MLENVTRLIISVICTTLVLSTHVEEFKDDKVSNQSIDMCFVNDDSGNEAEERDNIHQIKIAELTKQFMNDLMLQLEIKIPKNAESYLQHLKEEFKQTVSKMRTHIDQTENESIKQNQKVQENINKIRELFLKEIEKVRNDMINYRNQSKLEFGRLVHQLHLHKRDNFKASQDLFAKEMLKAQNELTRFMNQSTIESNELLIGAMSDSRGYIAKKMAEIMDNLENFADHIRNESKELDMELKREMKENVATLQKYIASEVRNSRSNINYEIRNHISEYGVMIWTTCAVQVTLVVLFCCWKRKPTSQQRKAEAETPELRMENSVAVVSFTEENRDLHLNIARNVASAFQIHPTYVGGLNNIPNIELCSKVCLVFVDKNERNIILETDVDISKTRSDFVEGQSKKGNVQLIVVYCQHEGSRDLTSLYNRNLGNIKEHATLRKLQRQNRVLTIDKQFSPYQTEYLKMFFNEILTE